MTDLKTTPLNALHRELGAKLVPFAGYEMPVQYPMGVMKEHVHCRSAAGLFDVSHMGQIVLRHRSGDVEEAARALEALVPVDVLGLKPGRQRYALLTNAEGGILDDLMVARRDDHLFLVVNAARKDDDLSHLATHLSESCEVTPLPDRALLALQGPRAEDVLEQIATGAAGMRFMDVDSFATEFGEIWVSRSGYTGEDGYEISVGADRAEDFARALLDHPVVAPIGLGARDSLRLEAGLCLHGTDIDETTNPVEANLVWAMQKVRRPDGGRAGGYPGAERIARELETGPLRLRVGLLPEGRAPIRAGVELFARENADAPTGTVTSGAFGPSIERPMAMGYVGIDDSAVGTKVWAELRGRRVPVTVTAMPFRPATYKR
ncbi:aminomethyltransferase [Palleronia aestuarii]|uniref:aminomethyltransferase n=1 Tax=Palleronia aestuarii TaxID=568105 RepID=A0A2W7P8M4_9RHOB|nr:glycine cleavage system aminomethyltransferase GcvT [Palleronia aestuarii]PZX19732.1 aminomethyltransferase [Palleronia aestuarii]